MPPSRLCGAQVAPDEGLGSWQASPVVRLGPELGLRWGSRVAERTDTLDWEGAVDPARPRATASTAIPGPARLFTWVLLGVTKRNC